MMKRTIKIVIAICFLTTTVSSQTYLLRTVAVGTNNDSLFLKINGAGASTDSFFRNVAGSYVFAYTPSIKNYFPYQQLTNVPTNVNNALAVNGNGSSLTGITAAQVGAQPAGTYATGTGTASGTNTGDNAVNTLYSGLVSNASHTGDATGSTALTLATVNSNVGSFTSANITVNAKGLVTAASNGSGISGPSRTFLPNDVINNNGVANTIADVTGLSFDVVANTTYKFRFFIVYSAAATTTGSRWSVNGPATTFVHYNSEYTLTASSITNNQGLAGYNVPAGVSASSLATGNICVIEGTIRPSANGTVIARFASEISASAITAIGSGRSYVEYQIIN